MQVDLAAVVIMFMVLEIMVEVIRPLFLAEEAEEL
jgi:hypothetical protein